MIVLTWIGCTTLRLKRRSKLSLIEEMQDELANTVKSSGAHLKIKEGNF